MALARALAVEPDCLLLDEPLSNLDAKLRLEMRSEIRRICKTTGFTTIYVTHDQKEAPERCRPHRGVERREVDAGGHAGRVVSLAGTSFVAGFIGQTNLLTGKVVGGKMAALR